MSKCYFKTESIRKLSNFNFQGTKTLYQNDFNNTAFFFTLFKGYKFDKLYEITPEKRFSFELFITIIALEKCKKGCDMA